MPQDHHLQGQRFELKYRISEPVAERVRAFVSAHLELDDFSAAHPDRAYDVHSIYFDSDELHTHHATVNGDKNRFKLRLRCYTLDESAPVFLEIKRRVDNCILKQRCPLRRAAVPHLLDGQTPPPELVLSTQPRHQVALENFLELCDRLHATPRLRNHYRREAWVSPADNHLRVTFDRDIFVEPWFEGRFAPMTRPHQIYGDVVVLEVKFTDRFPRWCQEMVEQFHLNRSAAMKYCGGVDALGPDQFRPRAARPLPAREALCS
ncbi:MAG: VTC domain-containing protein [Limisphaerales bacterium]